MKEAISNLAFKVFQGFKVTPNKIIFTAGTCEDDSKIQITLTGEALLATGHVQGIYVKFATSRGKPAWIHTSYDYSLWWGSNGFWMIGPKAEIGSSTGKSLSEALLFADYGENILCTKNCSECQKQFLYTTCSPQV